MKSLSKNFGEVFFVPAVSMVALIVSLGRGQLRFVHDGVTVGKHFEWVLIT